jgi:hypothetical protein
VRRVRSLALLLRGLIVTAETARIQAVQRLHHIDRRTSLLVLDAARAFDPETGRDAWKVEFRSRYSQSVACSIYEWNGGGRVADGCRRTPVESNCIFKIDFRPTATQRQIARVRELLTRTPGVRSFVFVSEEEALRRMKRRYPSLTEGLPYNPLPDSFEVSPKSIRDLASIEAALPASTAGVSSVIYSAWC